MKRSMSSGSCKTYQSLIFAVECANLSAKVTVYSVKFSDPSRALIPSKIQSTIIRARSRIPGNVQKK